MTEAHEIRVDGDRAWCETCDWSDLANDYFSEFDLACLHFCDPDPICDAKGGRQSALTVCSFCLWPDRLWVGGRPRGDQGVTSWPSRARWQWEIRGREKDWVLACEEHEHLGPSGKPNAYKLLLRAS
jgi:hypothetical protein